MEDKRKERRKREFVEGKLEDAACQLGVATVAAGIIALFVDPAEGLVAALAVVPIFVGLVLLYYGTSRVSNAMGD